MERPALLTEEDKRTIRRILKSQAEVAWRKSRFRRRRDVKHFWPMNAEGKVA